MYVFKSLFNALEEVIIAFNYFPTGFANVIMMGLLFKNVLKDFSLFGDCKFLDDLEGNEFFNVPINGCTVNVRHLLIHELLQFIGRNMAMLIVQEKLDEEFLRRSHSESVRFQVKDEVFMLFHCMSLSHMQICPFSAGRLEINLRDEGMSPPYPWKVITFFPGAR